MLSKKLYVLFLIFILMSCHNKTEADLLISNVNIIDVETGKLKKGMDIIIVENKIDTIIAHQEKSHYKSVSVIDCTNKFIIPGLWDMHVHLSMIGEESILLFVLNGVTGVRDMGGNWPELKAWRSKGNNSDEIGFPKIKTAGPILESPRFYGLYKQILGSEYVKNRIPIDTEKKAYAVVDSLNEAGVDFIKVRTVKSQEVFKAIAKACAKNNLPFTGHIEQNIGLEFAIDQNIHSIEHDIFLQALSIDDESLKTLLKKVENSNSYFSPTLLATNQYRLRSNSELYELVNDTANQNFTNRKYLSPELIENWEIQLAIKSLEQPIKWDSIITPMRSFAENIASKSTVISGTDCGVTGIIPGKGLHRELELLVKELGLSNLEALRSSTINAVESLNLQDKYGLIKSNFNADLLILNKNPLTDISQTSNIHSVIKNGILMDQNTIKEKLKLIENKVKSNFKTYDEKTLNHLKAVLKSMKSYS